MFMVTFQEVCWIYPFATLATEQCWPNGKNIKCKLYFCKTNKIGCIFFPDRRLNVNLFNALFTELREIFYLARIVSFFLQEQNVQMKHS